jgi:hypothetical protein
MHTFVSTPPHPNPHDNFSAIWSIYLKHSMNAIPVRMIQMPCMPDQYRHTFHCIGRTNSYDRHDSALWKVLKA